ncbi:MAG: sensor domain-containing diguanylate cyclase [Desulfotalea sp.]
MWNRKLRFVTLLAVLLVFGFLFTSFVSYFTAHESITTQVEKTTLPLTSDNIYSEIQRDLLQPIFISSIMAKDTFVRDWVLNGEHDENAIIRYLKEIQKHYGTVTSFFVSDKTRKYYHSSGVLKKVNQMEKEDAWYFRVQKMHQDYEINVDIDTADSTSLTIFINHRVYDYSGQYIGVIGVGLAVDAVQKLMDYYKQRYDRQVYFIDKKGSVTLRGVSYTDAGNIHQMEGLSVCATKILTSPSSSIVYEREGEKHYLNSRFVPEFDWYLIVEQQEDEAELRIHNTLMINLGVSLVISIVIIILVNLIINGYQEKLEAMATTDKLTGIANRQVFDVLFRQAYSQSKRNKTHLSAIMCDIDYFKQVNDTYGHPTGDVVLKTLSQTIKHSIRESDILFRWGGEEFLVILPESDLDLASRVAEKIRREVEDLDIIFSRKSISVTISMGVATMSDVETADDLIMRSDKALYAAKENGRNRVECCD